MEEYADPSLLILTQIITSHSHVDKTLDYCLTVYNNLLLSVGMGSYPSGLANHTRLSDIRI